MIKFNEAFYSNEVISNIKEVFNNRVLSGDGKFTKLCNQWFLNNYNNKSLLTHSCTAALEMAAILIGIKPGDEVIMPSYTFVSTANAFVLRGAKPVFVDIRKDNFNINEELIEEAITNKTKAIVPVHYAGVACKMDKIMEIAKKYNLYVIEDAAQAFGATYKGKKLGSIGDLGCFSFHETKNISSGEGGLLLLNNKKFENRAEVIREKGTNRSLFFRGQVDKYTWVDVGSSYLPSDLIAAYLYTQLPISDKIQKRRVEIWNKYYKALEIYQEKGLIRLPIINDFASNNAHMFYILFDGLNTRTKFISYMKENEIMTPFHYVPLHSSPAGEKFCRCDGDMNVTNNISSKLVRLPLFYDLNNNDQNFVIEKLIRFMESL